SLAWISSLSLPVPLPILGLFLEFVRAPASLLIGVWAALQIVFAYIGPAFGAVAWAAHAAGFLFGIVFAIASRGAIAKRLRRLKGSCWCERRRAGATCHAPGAPSPSGPARFTAVAHPICPPSNPMSKPLYKVSFLNHGKVYELYARRVDSGRLWGFVEVAELVFDVHAG